MPGAPEIMVPYPWIKDELDGARRERQAIHDLVRKLAIKVDAMAAVRAANDARSARTTRILIAVIGGVTVVAAAFAAN